MGFLSIMRVYFEVLAVKTPTSPSPWIQGSWSRTTRPRRQRRRSPLPLPLPSAAQARPPARNPSPAPFSYLTLYCPTFNESSDPKRRTYQIIYLVQGTLRFPVIRRRTIQLISNPKSLISLQPTKAFMRFS